MAKPGRVLPRSLTRRLRRGEKFALAETLAAQRSTEVESAAAATVTQAAAQAEAAQTEATGRSKFLAAIPWAVGIVVGLAALGALVKRRSR